MPKSEVIRHVCGGHEYRYNVTTGEVRNNYGSHVSSLTICRFTGHALLYRVGKHWPKIYTSDMLANLRKPADREFTDAELAQFAIGHTRANIKPE